MSSWLAFTKDRYHLLKRFQLLTDIHLWLCCKWDFGLTWFRELNPSCSWVLLLAMVVSVVTLKWNRNCTFLVTHAAPLWGRVVYPCLAGVYTESSLPKQRSLIAVTLSWTEVVTHTPRLEFQYLCLYDKRGKFFEYFIFVPSFVLVCSSFVVCRSLRRGLIRPLMSPSRDGSLLPLLPDSCGVSFFAPQKWPVLPVPNNKLFNNFVISFGLSSHEWVRVVNHNKIVIQYVYD